MKPKRKSPITRREARELALQILYAYEYTHNSLDKTINLYTQIDLPQKPPINEFTTALLKTVLEKQPLIDESLQKVITNWRLERLSIIDRNLLRLGTAEILFFEDIPPKVTINEYIEIAKEFGTQFFEIPIQYNKIAF